MGQIDRSVEKILRSSEKFSQLSGTCRGERARGGREEGEGWFIHPGCEEDLFMYVRFVGVIIDLFFFSGQKCQNLYPQSKHLSYIPVYRLENGTEVLVFQLSNNRNST